MAAKLFVISGASGSGKTTLLNSLLNTQSTIFKARKYSTRAVRDKNDDIIHCPVIARDNFDLVYKLNEKTYGIKLNEIKEELNKKNNLIIILSDIRVILRLKKELGDSIVTLYISSAINNSLIEKIQASRYKKDFHLNKEESDIFYYQYLKLSSAANLKDWGRLFECMGELFDKWEKYIPERDSTEIRKKKIRDFHKTYIDNIQYFDHVILNHNLNNPAEMTRQALNIIDFYNTNDKKQIKKNPILFFVAAASGSGKRLLMKSIRDVIGVDQVQIIRKEAKRDQKDDDDGSDGMIAIGENGEFSSDLDLRWTFHKGTIHKGTEYAVSKHEITANINNNKTQILISNTRQIERFKELFDNHVIFLYLHATRSDEDVKRYQYSRCKTIEEADQRIKEIEDVHNSYIENISKFDHVLLNTEFPEDLYEQMFKLIDHYNNQ